MGRPQCNVYLALLLLSALTIFTSSGQGIDEMIAAAYENVEDFGQLADLSGNVLRHELDMLLSKEQAEALKILSSTENDEDTPLLRRKRRKAIRLLSSRWTDRTIPYSISTEGEFNDSDKAQIQAAIDEWQKYTCVRFRKAGRGDNNKVHFANGNGCYSYVGMTRSGSQKIGLAKGCRFKGVIVHEIGHAVGFHHEQNRPDRDDYVNIITNNIPSHLRYNFKLYPVSAVDTMGVPYDYSSVMHYGGRAFSLNGQYTIRTRDPKNQNKIGNRKGLSYYDIMLANKMYQCNSHCDQSVRCPEGGFLGKDCSCWCPGYPVRKCEATGTVPTTTSGMSETTQKPCRDMNKNCPSWARSGYCGHNTYVKTYCKESCLFCAAEERPTTKAYCRDMNHNCEDWGKRGFCSGRYQGTMAQTCPKTCEVCKNVNTDPVENSATSLGCTVGFGFVFVFAFIRLLKIAL